MTECSETLFPFEAHFSRRVVAQFAGDWLTTEGGSLLLRQADRKIGLLRRVAGCFSDYRQPERIEHRLEEMLAQRIYGLALGYEDLNDHEQLRQDPLLGVLAGKKDLGEPLAGKSTLNRLELTPVGSPAAERYNKINYSAAALDELLVDLFLEAHPRAPREIVLDLDATDTPLHGRQEARFFHGYYGHYCYLPLYVFCGDHLLCARLRPSNIDASAGSLEEVQRMVRQIRARWPKTSIILRADSGFCREELLAWCENNDVDYVFGFARNKRLRKIIGRAMQEAKQEHRRTGKPARVFCEFAYRTKKSWSRTRRVIAKRNRSKARKIPATWLLRSTKKPGPRRAFMSSFTAREAKWKSHQGATEPICGPHEHGDAARQSVATVLLLTGLCACRGFAAVGLAGTEWAEAQADTIRLKLLKIAAQVRITARRIWVRYSCAYPWQKIFAAAWMALRC